MMEDFPFSREFAFDRWANGVVLETLQSGGRKHEEAVRLLAHVLKAQKAWLARLTGREASDSTSWPVLDLEGCVREIESLGDSLGSYLQELTEEELDAVLEYRNARGIPFRSTVRDILTHLFFHGTHHRAQIATLLREAETPPPALDYIFFARQMDEGGAA